MSVSVLEQRLFALSETDRLTVTIHTNTVTAREHVRRIAMLLEADRFSQAVTQTTIDVSDKDPPQVKAWLMSLQIGHSSVDAYWIADGAGLHLPFPVFATYYDDLWYPAADDIWIVDDTCSWILELCHEEIFTLRRFAV